MYNQEDVAREEADSVTSKAQMDRIAMNAKHQEDDMDKYVCDVCGYVYDPAEGDPANGVAPGTAFENVPDSWVCPTCGAGKEEFSKE